MQRHTVLTLLGLALLIPLAAAAPANQFPLTPAIESPHPTGDNYYERWTIQHPGASAISVHFQYIDVESSWDYVHIYDGANNYIASYTGYSSDLWTSFVPGDTVYIDMSTDSSVWSWGFAADSYEIMGAAPPVPELGGIALMAAGLVGIGAFVWTRRA